jgi:putative oxidoreductase
MFRKIVSTNASRATLLIRLMVGVVFLSEGMQGFWEMMHDSRTDWAMLLGSLFLLFRGGSRWSLDRILYFEG